MIILPGSTEYQFFYALTIIVLMVKFYIVLYLVNIIIHRKKETGKIPFDYLIGFLILIVSLFISRIFYLIFDFFLTYFDSTTYHIFPNVLFWKLASITLGLGGFFILMYVERNLLNFKTKGIISYFILSMSIVIFIYPVNSAQDFEFISTIGIFATSVITILPLFFFYIGYKTPEIRKIFMMFGSALAVYSIGGIILNENFVSFTINIYGAPSYIAIYLISIIFRIIGLIFCLYGCYRFYSRSIVKSDLDESTIKVVEKLGFDFTKPDEITEKEITFYKEQKICLVCKGKTTGFIFLCRDCETLYCNNCARTLIGLENACWVCELPFDESKPVNLPEKKDIEESVKIQVQKEKS